MVDDIRCWLRVFCDRLVCELDEDGLSCRGSSEIGSVQIFRREMFNFALLIVNTYDR